MAELYGIRGWGAGYFDINEAGNVTVSVPVNGKPVTSYATKTMGYGAGTYGFRINHNLNVHVGDFGKR